MYSAALGLLPLLLIPMATPGAARKTADADFQLPVERLVLKNGLVVLLSPDPGLSSVVVEMSFRAGTVYEPPKRRGLAHLVEHALMRGTTPDTSYLKMLESRGAREVSANTTLGFLTYRTIVPPEELPLALWVDADRIGHLPQTLDAPTLERHKKVVLQERAERSVDRQYGLVDLALYKTLFPEPHPLSGAVIGVPEELAQATIEDVKSFAQRYLVPANAVLVVVGSFDPALARRLVTEDFAGMPGGIAAEPPVVPRGEPAEVSVTAKERISRRPRVTVAWRLPSMRRESVDRLSLGALLLSLYTDGAFGTNVEADLSAHASELLFRMDVTLPYQKPVESERGEADVFLRYLTMVAMPEDLLEATNLAEDRLTLFQLDSLSQRASVLAGLERSGADPTKIASLLGAHWSYDANSIQETARRFLGKNRTVLLAEPTNPRQPKLERELR
ncbi:MAG: pitrilysin family protein [Myxococcota bacterium]